MAYMAPKTINVTRTADQIKNEILDAGDSKGNFDNASVVSKKLYAKTVVLETATGAGLQAVKEEITNGKLVQAYQYGLKDNKKDKKKELKMAVLGGALVIGEYAVAADAGYCAYQIHIQPEAYFEPKTNEFSSTASAVVFGTLATWMLTTAVKQVRNFKQEARICKQEETRVQKINNAVLNFVNNGLNGQNPPKPTTPSTTPTVNYIIS